MHSISQPSSTRSQGSQLLIVIDARHSIYSYQKKNEVDFDGLLQTFIKEMQHLTKYFYFVFFHKNKKKNDSLMTGFVEKCQSWNIDVSLNTIATNRIKKTIIELVTGFLGSVKPYFSAPQSQQKQNQHKVILVSHNPISFKFALITKVLNDLAVFKYMLLQFFYFSSYFQEISKKQMIEQHYYKCNHNKKVGCFSFFHVSSLMQVQYHASRGEINSLQRATVGYYFYPKKQNELLNHGILYSSERALLLPVDLRYYNQAQLGQIQVLFHKVLDLNKSKEIKFNEEEISLFMKNYEILVATTQGKILNLDPIIFIPIIASRVQFQDAFDRVLMSKACQDIMKQYGIKIRTPQYSEFLHNNNDPNQLIPNSNFPVIVKTKAAAFTQNCHLMAIVVKSEGLKEVIQNKDYQSDLILQELINHSGVIYKIYCIGQNVVIQKRKSIPDISLENFSIKEGFYLFDSQKDMFTEISKCLTKVVPPNLSVIESDSILYELIEKFSQLLRMEFKISLFGFDIIQNSQTKDCYLIDINHFPGFKNVDKIKVMFDDLFQQKF